MKDKDNKLGTRFFSDEELKRLCSTDKGGILWGKSKVKILPYLLQELDVACVNNNLNPCDIKIMDYGSGYKCLAANQLRNNGYSKVDCYDIGKNSVDGVHLYSLVGLEGVYDFVYSNNVLSIQNRESGLRDTLNEIACLMRDSGVYVTNFSYRPNYTGLDYEGVYRILLEYFKDVAVLSGKVESRFSYIVFKCCKELQNNKKGNGDIIMETRRDELVEDIAVESAWEKNTTENYARKKRATNFRFTFKPLFIWLINKGIKKSAFARVNLGISDSLFTHWLKSKDPPISTFLKIIEGCNGELGIEDFIEDLRFNLSEKDSDDINSDAKGEIEEVDVFGID